MFGIEFEAVEDEEEEEDEEVEEDALAESEGPNNGVGRVKFDNL